MSDQQSTSETNQGAESSISELNNEAICSIQEASTILTLDNSSSTDIPNHTRKIINGLSKLYSDKKFVTNFDLFNALLTSIALECGFLDTNILTDYRLNSNYSFDKYILENFALLVSTYRPQSPIQNLKFRFINEPKRETLVLVILSGDLVLLTSSILDDSSNKTEGSSLSLPLTRYVPLTYFEKIEKSFRNLKELSRKLKDHLFLPVRNDIYREWGLYLNPSLEGSACSMIMARLTKYLRNRDIQALKCTCRTINAVLKSLY